MRGVLTALRWLQKSSFYEVETFARPIDDEGATDEVFLCRRPA